MRPDPILYIVFALLAASCVPEKAGQENAAALFSDLKTDSSIRYAKRFSLAENAHCRVLFLFGNKNPSDTTARFVFLKGGVATPQAQGIYYFNGPCKRIASLSSVYGAMLCELGEGQRIVAVESMDYYSTPEILLRFQQGKIVELARGPQIDVEQTIALKPDVIFTFGMGEGEKGPQDKILNAKIPMVITVDHLEESPLARAEWIKFFAEFVGKRKEADSIFSATQQKYDELKAVAASAASRPTVFTEVKYGDIWYVPGGKSYAANYLRDAGADYVWKDDPQTGSLHLSFEEVLLKARDADLWLNQSLVASRKELLAMESRYAEFKAFKTGSLYNNIRFTNAKGYSTYWETGIAHPERVLSDLVQIFHPELKEQVKNDLYYYKKLE